MNKDYKLINSKTKEETICNKVTLEDGFDYNVLGLAEGGEYEAQNIKLKQMFNRICILVYFCVYLQYESIRLYTYKIRY